MLATFWFLLTEDYSNCLSILQLRVYAQPLQLHTAEYAANVTKIVFDYFEEYFDLSYSLPKLGDY